MRTKIITICIISLNLSSLCISAKSRQFYTARSKGVAGAGVASLLINDGLYLNPASLAWFKQKLIGLQYSKSNEDLSLEHKSQSISLIDTTTLYQGGLAYEKNEEFGVKRQRYSASFAKKSSKLSSIGITYRNTKDKINSAENKFHQLDIGYSRIFSQNLTFGAMIYNAFHRKHEESKATIGFQYKLSSMLYALGDASANLDKTSESQSLRGALQIKVLKDFYFRIGKFQDKQEGLQGNSIGFSWYPAKLMLDLSYLTSEYLESNLGSFLNPNEELKEINFSLATRF